MEDIGFILTSYVVTFASVALMAWSVIRRGKRLAAQLPAKDKPWT
jgi:heme exporter protein CcmD